MKVTEFRKLIREEIRKVLKEEDQRKLVTVQIADQSDNFYADPQNYSLPSAIQAKVGKPTFSLEAEYDQDIYEDEINKYVRKVEEVLLALGRTVVPSLASFTMEDGGIVFEINGPVSPDTKAKLQQVFKGAKAVEFSF
jgi:hypothetical protein